MTALERRLIEMGFGALLTIALTLMGGAFAGCLFWLLLIVGVVFWQRATTMTSSSSPPDAEASADERVDWSCSLADDCDVGDCN